MLLHAALFLALLLPMAGAMPARAQGTGAEEASSREPVAAVVTGRLPVAASGGTGLLPIAATRDWDRPLPEVARAVIILHGVARNAGSALRAGERGLAAAGEAAGRQTLLLAPQFLTEVDFATHRLPAATLRWRGNAWEDGRDARGPAPLSSFDALDAILARLADRTRFPALRQVVLAGHSGGGQLVQRYALLGRGEGLVATSGVRLRHVVANPSSYAYLSPERPDGRGGFALPRATSCPRFDQWKYGLQDLPRYARSAAATDIEAAYVAREVIILLGTADTDPRHPTLDRSCMAEAQGPERHARGLAFLAHLRRRHPAGLSHQLFEVPGVGHSARDMFGSACGIALLFGSGRCPD